MADDDGLHKILPKLQIVFMHHAANSGSPKLVGFSLLDNLVVSFDRI
jgi:hypothetical protein